jgi:hypothetical protein
MAKSQLVKLLFGQMHCGNAQIIFMAGFAAMAGFAGFSGRQTDRLSNLFCAFVSLVVTTLDKL